MRKPLLGKISGVISIVLLLVCIASSTALSEMAPKLSPMLSKWYEGTAQGEPVNMVLSASFHALVPFGEETLSAINRLMSEIRLQVGFKAGDDEETTRTQLVIGDVKAYDVTEKNGEAYLVQASLLPEITLSSSAGSPVEAFTGNETNIPFWAVNIPDPNLLIENISEILSDLSGYGVEKKGNYGLSSIATARKAQIYTVPKNEPEPLRKAFSKFAEKMNWPEAVRLFSTLKNTGNVTITLYQTAEGENIALGVKGNLSFEDVSPREVNFLWVFRNDEKNSIHTLSLKAPGAESSDYLTVTGNMKMESKPDKNTLLFELDIKSRRSKVSKYEQWNGRLDCLMAEDNQRLEGEIKQTVSSANDTDDILTIKPSLLAYMVNGEVSVKGNVRISSSRNKVDLTDVTISLVADHNADFPWQDTNSLLSLDEMSDHEASQLFGKAQEAAVKAIWQAVLTLPQESLKLITKEMSQEDWERIYQAVYQVGQ